MPIRDETDSTEANGTAVDVHVNVNVTVTA